MFEKLIGKLKEKNDRGEEISFVNFDRAQEEMLAQKVEVRPEKKSIPSSKDPGSNVELKVIRPETFSEVTVVADSLLAGCTVVLNLEALDSVSVVHMLDFCRGVIYAIRGEYKKVSATTYIFTPLGVDVSDVIQ